MRSSPSQQQRATDPVGLLQGTHPLEAGASSLPQTGSLSHTPLDPTLLTKLSHPLAASESFPSDSGDTGVDRARGSGASWGRSSDDRRQEEASLSEQGEGGSDSKSKRLKQNRLAARKSRQRRKQYVECLEEEVRTLRAELKRVQQTRCGQAGGTSSPSISLAVSAASASLPAAITPPRFLQWTPAPVPNPFQMAGERGHIRPEATPALGPLIGVSSNEAPAILLPTSPSQPPAQSASGGILHTFERWHAQHSVLVKALLEVRNQGSMVGPLAERIMSVVSHLSDFFRLKAAVHVIFNVPDLVPSPDQEYIHTLNSWSTELRGPDAHLVLSLQHLPQGQRRFATLGVLSCSDICAGLLRKLGPSLEPHQRLFLEQYKVLLTPQEAALHVLLSSTIAEMTKAMANDSTPSELSPSQPAQLTSPDTQAKLQLMCEIFMEADRLWERFLQHAQQYLSVAQFVTVVSAMIETGAGLEAACCAQARSQHLVTTSLAHVGLPYQPPRPSSA